MQDLSQNFHGLPIEETLKLFETSQNGLSQEEVKKRLERFGENQIKEEKSGWLKILWRQFNTIFIYILFAASIVSILIGQWTDFIVINTIILFNGMIAFWQEIKAKTSIEALKKLTESKNNVMRQEKIEQISSSQIVPGDYIVLHEGGVVTADIRLCESSGLMADESSLTGESAPVGKDHTVLLDANTMPYEMKNMLLTGTAVVRGTGRGVVVKTGERTYFASIAKKGEASSPETPLTRAINFFAIRYVILLIAFFFLLAIVGYLQGRSFIEFSYILLAGLVSAVPEGLPIVVTLVMVIGAIALSKKHSLIRHLPSVETMGSSTIILSDKTGTITEGKLTVKEVDTLNEEKLKLIAALCNDAHQGTGDPVDTALSNWVGKDEYQNIRDAYPKQWEYAFDAQAKFMATVNLIDGQEEFFIKGAFEALQVMAKGQDLRGFEEKLKRFVERGLRVLALGLGKWEKNTDPSSWSIQIVGLIGFLDPPKSGVKEAVRFAKQGGIRVVMITGDHPETAKAISREVEIYQEGDRVIIGKEIETMSDEKLKEELKNASILARILPEHKYRVVQLLQSQGEIVSVTGDGVNDVPALKAADIGIAMGSGTEAAKSVSKMIITDNNLGVIVDAIKNARVIAGNIRKVIYYLTSTSLQELILVAFAIFTALPLPLAAIQILWINIVTDGVLDKTFAFAKEEGNVMERKPRSPEKQFFDLPQILRILSFGFFMGLGTFFLFLFLLEKYPLSLVISIIFPSVVVAQWANGIQAQKETEPFFKNIKRSFSINPYIFIGLLGGIFLQLLATYVLSDLFHVVPLALEHLKYPLFSFLTAFGFVEIRKWIEWPFLNRP